MDKNLDLLEEVKRLLRSHKKDIEKYDVEKIGLFGSVVRGEQGKAILIFLLVFIILPLTTIWI